MLEKREDTINHLDYSAGAAEGAPLLIMLHGYGSNEKDLISLAPMLDRRLRVMSLQAPIGMGYESYAWFPIAFTDAGITVDREAAKRARDRLEEFLQETIAKFRPAGNKVFLMGFSQGAVMNYLTAFSSPELLHGVIALSGQLPDLPPEIPAHPGALTALPFLVVHGLFDDVLPIDKGREADRWLKENISDLTYREYPMGHEIDGDTLDLVAAWLRERLDRLA
ncbi:MAG: alpha/beta fold hydrolase [Chlorobiaceae bacterium]|nr:alpha/beta fold hydrolase [Chlorobiaceae bacterium]